MIRTSPGRETPLDHNPEVPKRQPTRAGLGEYLAARRAAIEPSSAGLTIEGYRRVAGLRREEVAVLAGVSVDYYTRLEQGREVHPSASVLDGLCRALDLRADARQHLYRLAGAAAPMPDLARGRDVSPELRQLITELRESPALVLNGALDVLARNALCAALHSGFRLADNIARMVFLDPLGRAFYEPWDLAAEATVASLRLVSGMTTDVAHLTQLIDELVEASPIFRTIWARHAVRAKTNEVKRYNHPDAGALTFSYQSFDVRGMPGRQLVVFGKMPNDDSMKRLSDYALR